MKKILSALFCIILIATMAASVFAAGEVSAPKATDIKIDGVKEASYGAGVDVKSYKAGGSGTGATGTVYTAWDGKNILYVFIEVNDTTPNHEANDPWMRDCIEVFFDFDSEKTSGSNANNGKPYWQVRIASAPNSAGVDLTGAINGAGVDGKAGFKNAIDYKVVPLSGSDLSKGYIIEFSINLEGITTLTEGKSFPIEVQIGDDEKGAGRSSQAFFATSSKNDTQYGDPSACEGVLTLKAAAAAVTPETTPATTAPAVTTKPVVDTPVTTPATTTPTVTTSPSTSDITILAAGLTVIAAISYTVIRKKVRAGK